MRPIAIASLVVAGAFMLGPGPQDQGQREHPAKIVTSSDLSIRTRDAWPIGYPVFVLLNASKDGPRVSHFIRATPDFGGGTAVETYVLYGISDPTGDNPWTDWRLSCGVPASPSESITFHLTFTESEWGTAHEGPVHDGGTLALPVRVGGQIADLMAATPIPEVDRALRDTVRPRLHRVGWFSHRGQTLLWLTPPSFRDGKCVNTGTALGSSLARHPSVTFVPAIEVLFDGKPVASAKAWWRGKDCFQGIYDGLLTVSVGPDDLKAMDPAASHWSVHITGDAATALRDFESNAYWKGDITLPLDVSDATNWDGLGNTQDEPAKR